MSLSLGLGSRISRARCPPTVARGRDRFVSGHVADQRISGEACWSGLRKSGPRWMSVRLMRSIIPAESGVR